MEVRENLLQIMDSREVLKIVKAVILKLAVRIHFRIYLTVLTLDEDPEIPALFFKCNLSQKATIVLYYYD